MKEITKRISQLVIISLIFKVVSLLASFYLLHTFIDIYDIGVYYRYANNIMGGMIPYVNFIVEYPQGFLIAIIPLFFSIPAYMICMVIYDTITVVCVYLIALKLWEPQRYPRKRAFISGLIYATAIASAYFTITKYDALPVMLMMLAIALYMYKNELSSYAAISLGFITKWFPGVVLPFFIIHDLKTGVDLKTISKRTVVAICVTLGLSIPFMILYLPGFIRTYTFHTGRTPLSSSFPYYIDFITGTNVFTSLSLYVIVAALVCLIGIYYAKIKPNYNNLLIFIFLAVFSFVMFNKVFSPQYYIWFAPFIALFLSKDYFEIIIAYITQFIMFIEFPLLYNVIYINDYYYQPYVLPLTLFTIKFAFLFYAAWLISNKITKYNKY